MANRWRRWGTEIARFLAVNGVATLVALGLFNLLVHGLLGLYDPPMNQQPALAYLIANLIGMFISFHGSRRYAFKHRQPVGPGGGLLVYAVVNTLSFLIPMGCLWASRNVMGQSGVVADNISANVVGAVLAMVFRYFAFKKFVFRRPRRSQEPQRAVQA